MSTIYKTPVLWAETSKGKKKFWQGFVDETSEVVRTYTQFWQGWTDDQGEEKTSKLQTSDFTIVESKNVGKANETSLADQGISEMKSQLKKQTDKGYAEVGSVSTKLTLPMLANSFGEKAHTVVYPCTIQPKYDGVRCITDGKKMWSRKGLEFIPEVVQHLVDQLPDNLPFNLDGELILPAGNLLQDTVKAAKKYREELSPKLLYRVYDVIDPLRGYEVRIEDLTELLKNCDPEKIIQAPRRLVENKDEVADYHIECVDQGWEGAMVRCHGHGYKVGQRSSALLKVKGFLEEEFLCTGVEQGEGKYLGSAVLICQTKEGLSFKVNPIGTMAEKQAYWSDPTTAVGKQWTVRFQSWTDDKKPFHARAINPRDPEIQG